MKRITNLRNQTALLLSLFLTFSQAVAQDVNEVFSDIEDKGSTILDFFTSGWFALALVSGALIFVVINIMQGKMEITRGIVIVAGCVFLGNVPSIAQWLIN